MLNFQPIKRNLTPGKGGGMLNGERDQSQLERIGCGFIIRTRKEFNSVFTKPMYKVKEFWKSKTLWFNILSVISLAGAEIAGANLSQKFTIFVTVLVASVNAILRVYFTESKLK